MLNGLKLSQKIGLLPGIAAVGAIFTIVATMVLGNRTSGELEEIEQGLYPSVEMSQQLEVYMTSLQRTLQDAVGASDIERIEEADATAAEMAALLATASENPWMDADVVSELSTSTAEYYSLARSTTSAMIEGTGGAGLMDNLREMTQRYSSVKEMLANQAESDRSAIEAAFASVRANQRFNVLFTTLMVVLAVGVLLALSYWIITAISKGIAEITEAAQQIKDGRIDQSIEYQSECEVGVMAAAFRDMIDYLSGVAAAADAVAHGNLEHVVEPRSEDDRLSHNMMQAMDALREVVSETALQIEAAQRGDLRATGDAARFDGVYRDLVDGMNRVMNAVAEPIDEASRVLARVADRDLSARVTGDYQGEYGKIKEAINQAVDNLDGALVEVQAASDQFARAADEINGNAQGLASDAGTQASSLEEVSASLQEMSGATSQNSASAKEAEGIANEASEATRVGVDSMNRLSGAIERIKSGADDTAAIVKTIDEIAFQTNLLALNAAVEAARAGDAGKGFAVVAEEVRNLAVRAAEAAKDTAELIEDSVRNAAEGVEINEAVVSQLQEIDTGVSRVRDVMSEISAASAQQGRGVAQISDAVDSMNSVTQATAARSEESASAAEELSAQAQRVNGLVSSFHLSGGRVASVAPMFAGDAPVEPQFAAVGADEEFDLF